MEWPLKIQGRSLSEMDVAMVRDILHENPNLGRTRLSVELCRLWGWCRPDGQYKDMACREMLRKLEKHALIVLPPRQTTGPRRMPEIPSVEVERSPIRCGLQELKRVTVSDARRSKDDEKLFNYLVKSFHYLSFGRPVGQNMKYLFRDGSDRVLGCALFGAAAWKAEDRDRWIGWVPEVRERNLGLMCGNTRFLILPWVEVPHLASHVLGACLRRLSRDWVDRYGSPIVLVETFVDTTRFRGTCYKAANWRLVGKTKGRSRQDRNRRLEVPVKDILVYPLRGDFRKFLLV